MFLSPPPYGHVRVRPEDGGVGEQADPVDVDRGPLDVDMDVEGGTLDVERRSPSVGTTSSHDARFSTSI